MTVEKQQWTLVLPQDPLALGEQLTLPPGEFHYVAHVLRLQPGAALALTNGQGGRALGHVVSVDKKRVVVAIESVSLDPAPTHRLALCLGLPKRSALEEIVFQASEMGVYALHVFRSEKCGFSGEWPAAKLQQVAAEALRISKGAFCPQLSIYRNLQDMVAQCAPLFASGWTALCDENHVYTGEPCPSLLSVVQQHSMPHGAVFLGPEGGFTRAEKAFIVSQTGAQPVSLGQSMLRATTAACVVAATVHQAWG